MNYRPHKSLQVFAAALVVLGAANSQAAPADTRLGKAAMIKPVAVVTALHDKDFRGRFAGHDREAFSPLALTEERLDEEAAFERNAVRLYPIGNGDATREGSGTPSSTRAGKDIVRDAPRAKRAALPEPGNWAMILAGLLSVGAIARRRMSA